MSVLLYVIPHGKNLLPLGGFSWNLIFCYFLKMCVWEFEISLQSGKNNNRYITYVRRQDKLAGKSNHSLTKKISPGIKWSAHVPDAVCTILDSWWWTERPSETCRALFQNKINLRYCASGWFYYRNTLRCCTVLQTSNPLNCVLPLIQQIYLYQTSKIIFQYFYIKLHFDESSGFYKNHCFRIRLRIGIRNRIRIVFWLEPFRARCT